MEIVFATNNPHKLSELRRICGDRFTILSLSDIGCHDDIPETASTLEGNALIKARWVRDRYGKDCFADDTGLMVDALDGAPGVLSARYAGDAHDSQANMRLLLRNLGSTPEAERTARFTTVIALCLGEDEHLFRGSVEGRILSTPVGSEGFGYDPVFCPEGVEGSFATMTADEKNAISHRGRATAALISFLESLEPSITPPASPRS